jgi:hypothetical protein
LLPRPAPSFGITTDALVPATVESVAGRFAAQPDMARMIAVITAVAALERYVEFVIFCLLPGSGEALSASMETSVEISSR